MSVLLNKMSFDKGIGESIIIIVINAAVFIMLFFIAFRKKRAGINEDRN